MPDGTLSEIERQVAQDRAAFEASLERLSDTLAPDRLKHELSEAADRYGSELGGQAWTAARENPVAFALVGAGLALLLSGTGQRSHGKDKASMQHPVSPVSDERANDGADTTISDANASLRNETQSGLKAPSAKQLRAALHHGLDALPPEARARVLDARHAALRAQESLEHRAARARQRTDRIVRDRPITTGAAAFGIGALIAALLPSTKQEDAVLGKQRDALMDHARRALQIEMARLREAAASSSAHGSRDPAESPEVRS